MQATALLHGVDCRWVHLARSLTRPLTRTRNHNDNRNRQSKVTHFAGVLANTHGVEKGDRVLIYMPMIPQGNPCSDALMRIIEALQALTPLPRCAAVIAMLACARIGAIHSVVFGGFAADQLAVRIDHAKPKVMSTCEREWLLPVAQFLGRVGAQVTLSASCGIEPHHIVQYKPLLDRAIEMAKHKPQANIIYQR